MRYEAVIGLEVHAQLLTNTKIFCGCATKFGASPNTQVCPVCLGMPGSLPVLNKRAVEYAVRMAIATNCTINRTSVFARKNYFYPDLPKGYQISQYDQPLAENGFIDIEKNGDKRRIGITRIHMEEDAGKLVHHSTGEKEDYSLVDLNRAGVPLIEIVSEPDIRSPEEASVYLKAMREILLYLNICDGNMEKGSFRCDANLSIRPEGDTRLGTKTELKNMNSFKFVRDALEYEMGRQRELAEEGSPIVQETRLFDTSKGVTLPMRKKEDAHDYRYFPEPDLPPLELDNEWVKKIGEALPELPHAKRERFIKEYSLSSHDAEVLTSTLKLAYFYESTVKLYPAPKEAAHWITGELLRLLKSDNRDIQDCPLSPSSTAKLLKIRADGKINAKTAKEVFEEMYHNGTDAALIIEQRGLVQISDETALQRIVNEVIETNPESVQKYKQGKSKLFGFFVGQVMRLTQGQANPQVVTRLIKKGLSD